MAINFPSSPTTGQSYTDTTTGQTWIYNGTGWASSYNRSSVVRQQFTASAGQTTFTVSGGYAPGLLDVYQNGVKLVSGSDYSASNGTTVILTVGASAGDSVEVWGLALFTVANMPTLAQLYAETGDAGPISMRNRIINGDMRIDQRNNGASANNGAGGLYTLDRWSTFGSQASKFSIQQNAGSVTGPVGFQNYLGITSTSAYSVGASESFSVRQYIEGYNTADLNFGTANAVTVTLSFWVRSSLTGSFGGSLYNSAGNRFYPFTYTINNANTWELKSIVIPGDVTGTWVGATNGIGLAVQWSLGAGSSVSGTAGAWASSTALQPSGSTSVVGTNGATFYLTGVQLEMGGTATAFERRNYQQELAMCQRYYAKTYNTETTPGTATTTGYIITTTNASGWAYVTWNIAVAMRASPTITAYNHSTGATGTWQDGGGTARAVTVVGAGSSNVSFGSTASNLNSWLAGHAIASAEL
jgi:hypothetical protein